MFLDLDQLNTVVTVGFAVALLTPLALRIGVGVLQEKMGLPGRLPMGTDETPFPLKIVKGLLTALVIILPVGVGRDYLDADQAHVALLERAGTGPVSVSQYVYLPESAMFGLAGRLPAIGLAAKSLSLKSGADALSPEQRALIRDEGSSYEKGLLLFNLTGDDITAWTVLYLKAGVMPLPPVPTHLAPGEMRDMRRSPVYSGCENPPPQSMTLQGERMVFVRSRIATIEGESSARVIWLSWPGMGPCLAQSLGLIKDGTQG